MRMLKKKKTIGSSRLYLTRSKKRLEQEEAAIDEKDLISSLPLDLKLQILAKLPPKSIAKFISVSKLWSRIVRGKDLRELFISRSSTRPSLLFTVATHDIRKFHFRSQKEPSSGNRSTSSITPNPIFNLSPPVHGLVCGEELYSSPLICNPSTGQFVILPRVRTRRSRYPETKHFLGYDPVNDVYKVLCVIVPNAFFETVVQQKVFTLASKKKAWKKIKSKHPHYPATKGLCKDGVVYYGAWYNSDKEGSLIVSFDVRSEDFGVIKLPEGLKIQPNKVTELVNYHEGMALVNRSYTSTVDLWVLVDIKKQEWSKTSVSLPDIAGNDFFDCRGTISTGEIIFAPSHLAKRFFIVCYDFKRNEARIVDIEGVKDRGCGYPITVFLDHVENPIFLEKEV